MESGNAGLVFLNLAQIGFAMVNAKSGGRRHVSLSWSCGVQYQYASAFEVPMTLLKAYVLLLPKRRHGAPGLLSLTC